MSLLPRSIPFERVDINRLKETPDITRWLNSFIKELDRWVEGMYDWTIDVEAAFGGELTPLNPGRVVIVGPAGELDDDADLTFSGDTLTATKVVVTNGLTVDDTTLVVNDVTHRVEIGSADGSDKISIYHDNTDAFINFDDGSLILQTTEAVTNRNTLIQIKGKGTGRGEINLYDGAAIPNRFINYISGGIGNFEIFGTSIARIRFQPNADANITYFEGAGEGETEDLAIYGFRTGDEKRGIKIAVGIDADDTASFYNIGNYRFDGNIEATDDLKIGTDVLVVDSVLDTVTVKGFTVETTRVTSSPYAVLPSDDDIFVNTNGEAITVNLPAGVEGKRYRVINTGSSGNAVTLSPNGTEKLFGENSSYIILDGDVEIITYEGSGPEGWW